MPRLAAKPRTLPASVPSCPEPAGAQLSFAAYAAGSDGLLSAAGSAPGSWQQPACVLELSYELWLFFEQRLPVGLLQNGLVALAPAVNFCATLATPTEPARLDYPFLSDEDTDHLLTWCLGQGAAGCHTMLDQLLDSVRL